MRHLACLVALATVAAAGGSDGDFGKALIEAIAKNEGLPEVVACFKDDKLDALAADPGGASSVCLIAAMYVHRAPAARDDWEHLVERIVALGHKTMELAPADAFAVEACAEADVCRLRLAAALKQETTAEGWMAAAELCLKSHELFPGEGREMERAAEILREGARAEGVDGTALLERAKKVCEEGSKRYPGSIFFQRMALDQRLAEIEAQVSTDRRAADQALCDYLDELRGKIDQNDKELVIATAYTDAVTVARSSRAFKVKADYVTRTLSVAGSTLEAEMPLSSRWKYARGNIEQTDRNGNPLRTFIFDTYGWDTNYYIGQTSFGGDNLKGLAKLDELNAEEMVVKIEKRRKPARRRLNRRFPSAIYFEVSGYGEDADYLRWVNYYVKTEKRVSVQVSYLEFQEAKDLDPEAEFVVDSFREPK